MRSNKTIVKQYDAISFHNYVYGYQEYYNFPKIDIVITSPPYNIGVPYTGYKDNIPRDTWLDTIVHSLHPTDKICNEPSLMYLNMKGDKDNPLQSMADMLFVGQQIEELSEWKFMQEIVWVMPNKQHTNPMRTDTIFSRYNEKVFLFSKGKLQLQKNFIGERLSDAYLNDKRYQKAIQKMKDKFGNAFKDIGDVWVIPIIKTNQYVRKHNPAEFPPELPEWCIKTHPKHGGPEPITVYDPFVGGGTTAMIAERMGYNYYVCDISEAAIGTTKRRIKECQKMTM
jgi:site-specific DNA-methyltransferase (adenine-specific)